MTIAAILHNKGHDIVTIGLHVSLAEVCHTLAEHRIGAVPVTEEAAPRHILGMLSERDIVRAIATHGAAALAMTAQQVMTRHIRTASPRVTVGEAMEMMTEGRFRHLPVVDAGELVGLVSIGDVVKARIETVEQESESLKAYVAGSM